MLPQYHNKEDIVYTLEISFVPPPWHYHLLQLNTVLAPIQFSSVQLLVLPRIKFAWFELHINGIIYHVFFDISLSTLVMRFICDFVIVVANLLIPITI